MLRTIKKYLALDYLYYALPCMACVLYLAFALSWQSLQYLVNSMYKSFFTLLVVALSVVAVPNFVKLIYYTKRTLELPGDICIPSTTSERFGGAGEGKTSSALLQAVFEAEKLYDETETEYYYLRANYDRFKKIAPWKLKNFAQIEKSVKFWQEHPEYIPYLGSNVEIRLPNGQKSIFVTRHHLEQQEWLPICFIVLDEAGTTLPQDEWQDRPADVVLFFRFIRHFGFKGTLCEQKKDGILINVRAVLGGTLLCMGQRNVLLPGLLIDIISFLKRLLKRCKNGRRLGLVIEKLQNFASCIGFRIWEQLYFKTMEFVQYKPPVAVSYVCTNKMPFSYDETAFSDLWLAKDGEAKVVTLEGDYITLDSEMGKLLYRTHYEQEELRAKKELEKVVELQKLQIKKLKSEKELQSLINTDTK